MSNPLTDQYDSLYRTADVIFGKGKPVEAVTKLPEFLQSGTVLDIGGGEGRNAIYLAEHGYDATVTDLSKVGLEKLQNAAAKKNLHIVTKISDALTDGIDGTYDAIVLTFVTHHMQTEDAIRLIQEAQEHTAKGGVHVLVTFSNQGGLYERNIKSGRFYPNTTAIEALYADWDIKVLSTEETRTHARDKQGQHMQNHALILIATK